jgi:hypothetical protein
MLRLSLITLYQDNYKMTSIDFELYFEPVAEAWLNKRRKRFLALKKA